MKETTKQFLKLFFDPGETICISPNQFSYDSILQESLNSGIELKGVSAKGPYSTFVKEQDLNLIAINPISGKRNDDNVTSFRSFLIELDDGPLDEQSKYIEESGLPYSICVFSGNKSLHYGVVLDDPAINIDTWRYVNQWILNILEKADQQTKNPSRCIRFPDNIRLDWDVDKKKMIIRKKQSLEEIKNRISQETLNIWLNKFPEAMPQKVFKKTIFDPNNKPNLKDMPKFFWEMLEALKEGEQESRNASWFQVSCVMAKKNFEIDYTLNFLEQYYNEESDFRRREWETCIKSAFKHTQKESI